jgi:tetratricopeptide (TPR) repeat protein
MGTVPGGDHDLYAVLAETASRERNAEDLAQYAPLAEEAANLIGHRLHLAIAHRAWGVAHTLKGEYAQARHRLASALEIFESYPAPWQIARTLHELGEVKRLEGDAKGANDDFSRAIDLFEGLRAAPDIARTRAAMEP